MQLRGSAGSIMVYARRCEPKLAAPVAYWPLATPPNLLSTGPRQDRPWQRMEVAAPSRHRSSVLSELPTTWRSEASGLV